MWTFLSRGDSVSKTRVKILLLVFLELRAEARGARKEAERLAAPIKVGLRWTLSCRPAVLCCGCSSGQLSTSQTTRCAGLVPREACSMGLARAPPSVFLRNASGVLPTRSTAIVLGTANCRTGGKSLPLGLEN